jgi:signal transduction histidine kinase
MNIRTLTEEVRELTKLISRTNQQVTVAAPDKTTEKLAAEINHLVERYKELQLKNIEEKRQNKEALANFSHDLRTPLTSAMGYIDIVLNMDLSIKDKEKYLNIVQHKLKSLNNLVDSLYDLSLVDAREYPVQLNPHSLYQLLCDSLLLFHQDFEDKGISLQLDLDEKVPLVLLDEKITNRVFLNLFQNVIRYARSYCRVELKVTEEHVHISISNDSEALSEETVVQLFNRTYRADISRSGNSSGLGLAIAKELMELQRGRITADYKHNTLTFMLSFKR